MGRLERLLLERSGSRAEFTLNRLCELVKPNNRIEFALALGELVRLGGMKVVFRVVSPTTQGGVGDFDSFDDVPPEIHDWRTDTHFQVEPENLRTIFLVPANDATA